MIIHVARYAMVSIMLCVTACANYEQPSQATSSFQCIRQDETDSDIRELFAMKCLEDNSSLSGPALVDCIKSRSYADLHQTRKIPPASNQERLNLISARKKQSEDCYIDVSESDPKKGFHLAQCLIKVDDIYLSYVPNPNTVVMYEALTLALGNKVDDGQLTKAQSAYCSAQANDAFFQKLSAEVAVQK